MKTNKLSIADFTEVGVDELLAIKGRVAMSILVHGDIDGREGGGGCAGDSNGFGGTFDANEVVVSGERYPERVWTICALCESNANENILPRRNHQPLMTAAIQTYGHDSGCRNAFRNTYRKY